MTRKYTRKLFELMDEGIMSPEMVAEMALNYMSEADVEDMCRINDVFTEEDEERLNGQDEG